MAIFGPKAWGNPFGKMSILRPVKILVLTAEKDVFSFQTIVNTFLWSILQKKKKVGKMTIFGPKP